MQGDPAYAKEGSPGKFDVIKMAKAVSSEWKGLSDAEKRVRGIVIYQVAEELALITDITSLFSLTYSRQNKPRQNKRLLCNSGETR